MINPNYRLFKMKDGFTLGENVTQSDIKTHKKLNEWKDDDVMVVVDEDSKVVYIDE
jgi:hypothetical protein|tara:strand:+ start:10954 stop:11121 length:168 start_codon:yes stop_codon:yes gene_type:complete